MTTYANAKYRKGMFGDDIVSISVTINGIQSGVPIDINNRDYRKMKPLIDSGELMVADAVSYTHLPLPTKREV